MYEVKGNRLKQLPDKKPTIAHEMEAYIKEYNQLPAYPISGPHTWVEGQQVEEGRDFRLGYSYNEKLTSYDHEPELYTVAIPIIPVDNTKNMNTGQEPEEKTFQDKEAKFFTEDCAVPHHNGHYVIDAELRRFLRHIYRVYIKNEEDFEKVKIRAGQYAGEKEIGIMNVKTALFQGYLAGYEEATKKLTNKTNI